MACYHVSDSRGERLLLVGPLGSQHVARALHGADAPAVGAQVQGPRPAPGFAILVDASNRRMCRVIFEEACALSGAAL